MLAGLDDEGGRMRMRKSLLILAVASASALAAPAFGQSPADERRWEDAQRLLVSELNHRVKNMLAVVQSIAQQTRRSSADVAAFTETCGQRIQALAVAHNLLTRRNWASSVFHDSSEAKCDGLIAAGLYAKSLPSSLASQAATVSPTAVRMRRVHCATSSAIADGSAKSSDRLSMRTGRRRHFCGTSISCAAESFSNM